jgi:hypothetical protein
MIDGTFNPQAGTLAKQEGMQRAARSCNPIWWAWMLERVQEVARRKPYFNTDDIERLRQDRQGPRTHEKRAMGPLMKYAQKLGYCEPTDQWVSSSQDVNHRRPMTVWYSLIYAGEQKARRPRARRISDPRQYSLLDC